MKKKMGIICLILGLAIPIIAFAFVNNYKPHGGILWNITKQTSRNLPIFTYKINF